MRKWLDLLPSRLTMVPGLISTIWIIPTAACNAACLIFSGLLTTEKGPGQQAHATSFVISSPDARSSLDDTGLIGKGWWGDQWWLEADSSGIFDVECHSWDHVHPELDHVAQQDQLKGDFSQVKTFADAEIQFKQAGEYIAGILAGKRPHAFCLPLWFRQ